jgi:hypothetical protein
MAVSHPSTILHPLRDFNKSLNTKFFKNRIEPGEDVMEKEWDNLIIADCARVDYFRDVNDLSGELSSIRSKGSASTEFIKSTFGGQEYYDTIYVTGNSSYDYLNNRVFFYAKRIYRGNTIEERRENARKLVEQTLKLNEKYPNKRLITHFMIAHTPYLSEEAAKLREEIADRYEITFRTDDYAGKTDPSDGHLQMASLLQAARFGLVNNDQLQDMYQRDMEIFIQKARKLSESLDGKTAVTSDHAELLGERLSPMFLREWGHGNGLYRADLRQVPWLEVDNGERRTVRADEPIEIENVDEEAIQENLEALGYK